MKNPNEIFWIKKMTQPPQFLFGKKEKLQEEKNIKEKDKIRKNRKKERQNKKKGRK